MKDRTLAWSIARTVHNYAVAFLPLVFPLYLVRFSVGGIPTTLLECITGLLFLSYLVFEVRELRREHSLWHGIKAQFRRFFARKEGMYRNNVVIPVILFIVAAAFSLSPLNTTALGVFKGWIIVPILYFIMWSDINDDHYFLRLGMRSYFLSATVLAGWGLYQVVSGDFITPDGRASGPFQSANYLAMYIGPAVAVLSVLVIKRLLKRNHRIGHEMAIIIGQLLICGSALFMAQSYAAIIAVFGAIIFYLMLKMGVSLFTYWGRSLVGLLLLGALFFGIAWGQSSIQQGYKFINLLNTGANTSSGVRIEIWHVASHYVSRNPIDGIGLWQFQERYEQDAPRILGKAPFRPSVLHPHNLFMTTWLSTGLLGLFAFLWILYAALQRISIAPTYVQSYVRVGITLLVVIMLHGFFDTTFWKNDLAFLFWFSIGLARA